VAHGGEAILLFGKLDPSSFRLGGHLFVPIENHLRSEGWMSAPFERDLPPVRGPR
jgi:hypothetical protein